jgi:tRNA threonylcarbamoyladenosine biosynthesis protein TsaB
MRLAIETATDRASVALGASAADAVERTIVGARRQAAELLPAIDALLRERRVGLAAVTSIVLSDGPGSFTGLRVGAAVAKALVQARELPLWIAPSLLVRARGVARPGETVLAVANALRGDLYAAAYRFGDGTIQEVLAPSVYRPAALVERRLRPDRLVGEAPAVETRVLEEGLERRMITGDEGAPRARVLLGLPDEDGGAARVDPVEGWQPEYGRPAEAQARWEAAHGRPLPDSVGHAG